MSSNIELKRICQFCKKEFIAKTTVTKYCGDNCAKKAYKVRHRAKKIELSNKETRQTKIEMIEGREFLTAKEVATLLNCSVRTVYNYIEKGKINAVNLGERLTRVRRSDIDELFY